MIHASRIPTIMDQTDGRGNPKPFDLVIDKASTGERIQANGVVMLSYHHRGGTINLKFPNGEIRKFHIILIQSINGKEVYL